MEITASPSEYRGGVMVMLVCGAERRIMGESLESNSMMRFRADNGGVIVE